MGKCIFSAFLIACNKNEEARAKSCQNLSATCAYFLSVNHHEGNGSDSLQIQCEILHVNIQMLNRIG